jgi:hypothetical protein
MFAYLLLAAVLLLLGLATWRLCRSTGPRLASLPWLGLAAVLGLCALFHLRPHLAPPLLAGHLEPVAARAAGDNPLVGLLGPYPWLVLGLLGLLTAVPHLLRLHGWLVRLPGPPAAPPARPLVRDLPEDNLPPPASAAAPPPTLRVGLVGPWRGGKSELIDQACLGLARLVFSHKFTLGVEEPRLLNSLLQKRHRLEGLLPRQPRVSTVGRHAHPLALLESGRPRLRLELHDPVGQLVQFTTPSSPEEMRRRCDGYQEHLASVDVLWLVLPCPSREAGRDERQAFFDALTMTTAYVRTALEQRCVEHPLALAVVISRIDARYTDEPEARARLPRELLDGLDRLFRPLAGHPRLGELVLAPVSAWGFGSAVAGTGPQSAADGLPPEPGPTWLLRRGPQPFNVGGLVLWSLAAGLGCQPAPAAASEAGERARLHRLLTDELSCGPSWIVPVSAA